MCLSAPGLRAPDGCSASACGGPACAPADLIHAAPEPYRSTLRTAAQHANAVSRCVYASPKPPLPPQIKEPCLLSLVRFQRRRMMRASAFLTQPSLSLGFVAAQPLAQRRPRDTKSTAHGRCVSKCLVGHDPTQPPTLRRVSYRINLIGHACRCCCGCGVVGNAPRCPSNPQLWPSRAKECP